MGCTRCVAVAVQARSFTELSMPHQNRKQPTFHTRLPKPKRGLALLEVLVAAGLVLTLLTVTTPVVLHVSRVWKQVRHTQLAHDELAATLDYLLALPTDQRSQRLGQLQVSDEVKNVLVDAALTVEQVDDQDGLRLIVKLDWQRIGDPPPVQLIGWIRPTPAGSPGEAGASEAKAGAEQGSTDSAGQEDGS